MRASLFAAAAVTALALVSPARAAEPLAVSTIPTLPRATMLKTPTKGVTGIEMKMETGQRLTWTNANADSKHGYCFAESDNHGIGLSTSKMVGGGSDTQSEVDLWRIVEAGGKATLERTRVALDFGLVTSKTLGRSSTELRTVAQTKDVVAWAFRDGVDIIIVVRGADRGFQSLHTPDSDGQMPFVSADGCPFGAARMDARKPNNGALVQLAGGLPDPTTKKDATPARFFTVDASLSRVTRDPEPLLAVRVRTLDRD